MKKIFILFTILLFSHDSVFALSKGDNIWGRPSRKFFYWGTTIWSDCSAVACGTQGIQERSVTCREINLGKTVADSYCSKNPKPPSSQICYAPACPDLVKGFHSASPSYSVTTPYVNEKYEDLNYNLEISKVTAPSQITDGKATAWTRQEYSRRPAFNADGTKAVMISSGGYARLYSVEKNTNVFNFILTLPFGGDTEPNWHATTPDLLYTFDKKGSGMRIYEYNAALRTYRIIRDLGAKLRTIFPYAARAWTRGEGRPSNDQKVWCMIVENSSAVSLGLVAYDFVNDRIIGSLMTGASPNNISTSASGKYCVPAWPSPNGTRAYTTNFSKFIQLHTTTSHSDVAVSQNGKDALVFFDYNTGDVAMKEYEINTSGVFSAVRTNLFRIYGANSSSTSGHVSGVSMRKPGYAVISMFNCTELKGTAPCSYSQWYKNKVVVVSLKSAFIPSEHLYNITQTNWANAGYWGQTHAVPNSDLSKILFVSSWGSTLETDVASYMVDIPVGSLP